MILITGKRRRLCSYIPKFVEPVPKKRLDMKFLNHIQADSKHHYCIQATDIFRDSASSPLRKWDGSATRSLYSRKGSGP